MNDNRLYTEQRRRDILRIIRQDGMANVNMLAERFGVSGTTIRLDLTALERTGTIVRTHGGAVLSEDILPEPLISERVHDQEKARIAERAVAHIEDNDVLLIDTGTTMIALARALTQSKLTGLTVYSNDLEVLRILEEKEGWTLFMLGGKLRNGFHYTFSHQMIQALQELHFKKLFLATSALSLQEGLTTANPDLALLKEAMIRSSERVFLLADASKLHRIDLQRFATLDDVDILITDKGITQSDVNRLQECVRTVETA